MLLQIFFPPSAQKNLFTPLLKGLVLPGMVDEGCSAPLCDDRMRSTTLIRTGIGDSSIRCISINLSKTSGFLQRYFPWDSCKSCN